MRIKINNGKNVVLVLLVSLLLVLIAGCIDKAASLPDSFTIRLYSGGGSSGSGTGSFEEILIFEDNILVSGTVRSEAYLRSGTFLFECVLDTSTNSWTNTSKNLCYNVRGDTMSSADFWSLYPVYTKSMLEGLIRAPKNVEHISLSDQCGHGEICYEIT